MSAEADLSAEDEHAALAELLRHWRALFPTGALMVGACDVAQGVERRHYSVRLAHSNTSPVELLILADRALEEAAALLRPMPFAEADPLLVSALEARQALGFTDPKQDKGEMN